MDDQNQKKKQKKTNVSRIRKKTFYLEFCMGIPESHQKSIFNTPKVKKNKDTYEIYPTKFASSTQQHKKVIETPNQPIEIKKISNKRMISTLKVKKARMEATRRSLQAPHKILKKIIRTPNLPIRTKIFPKKVSLVP
jgi:competence CoiA-like predicted nuclease